LQLPGLSKLPLAEIIAVHGGSPAFASFREHFVSALSRSSNRAEAGESLQNAFYEETMVLREVAHSLEDELRRSTLWEKVKGGGQELVIGGFSALATQGVMSLLGMDATAVSSAIQSITKPVSSILFWLLFGKCLKSEREVARIYNAVLEKN
jgi:hypothetical protein